MADDVPVVEGRNRRFDSKKIGRWLVFVGDCKELGDALAKKPLRGAWLALSFLDALMRGYGQVVFSNNPITGFLFAIGLTIADPFVSLVGFTTASIGLLTSVILQQPPKVIRAGLTAYNALLLGLCTSGVLPALYGLPMDVRSWLYLVVGAVFSVYLTSALSSLLGSIGKYPMPCFAVPFVTVQMMLFICVVTSPAYDHSASHVSHKPSSLDIPELPTIPIDRTKRNVNLSLSTLLNDTNILSEDTQDGTSTISTVNENIPVVEVTVSIGDIDVNDSLFDVAIEHNVTDDIRPDYSVSILNGTSEMGEEWMGTSNDTYGLQTSRFTSHPLDNSYTSPIDFGIDEDRRSKGIYELPLMNASEKDPNDVDWGQVLAGIVLSMTQVFGACNVPGAVVMYIGLLIFSPTTGFMCFLGAFISTLTALLFCPPPYTAVYEGVWGFNGLLCAGALGGFCFVLTWQSALSGVVCALFATCLQNVLNPLFAAVPMPIMSVPFNISTLIFLCVTTAHENSSLVRPPTLTFPEKHRAEWKNACGMGNDQNIPSPESCSDTSDEKKLRSEEA